MSLTINRTTTFAIVDCAECSMPFGVTTQFQDRRWEDHQEFYCPAGHSNVYQGETKAEKLERQLAAARGNAKAERERLERERRSHAATKGQLTKTKKRVAGGVCPCCNRSFVNLGRHMAGQHPGYGEATTS